MKLLHLSDIHLGANLKLFGEKAAGQRQHLVETLAAAVKLAIEERMLAVVFTGDIFDHYYPAQSTVERFVQAVKQLVTAGIYVVILPGNHDRLEEKSVWHELPRLVANEELFHVIGLQETGINELSLANGDLFILARPCLTQKTKESPLAGIKERLVELPQEAHRVVLAHGSVSLAQEAGNYPISKEEIADLGADYLALGDWHGLLDVSQGEQVAYYAGALDYLNFDQAQSGHGLVVTLTKGSKVKVEPRKLSDLTLVKQEYNCEQLPLANLGKEVAGLGGPKTMVQVKLTGRLMVGAKAALDLEEIKEQLLKQAWLAQIVDQTELELDFTSFSNFPANSLPHEFIKLLEAEVKKGQVPKELAAGVLKLGLRTILQ